MPLYVVISMFAIKDDAALLLLLLLKPENSVDMDDESHIPIPLIVSLLDNHVIRYFLYIFNIDAFPIYVKIISAGITQPGITNI